MVQLILQFIPIVEYKIKDKSIINYEEYISSNKDNNISNNFILNKRSVNSLEYGNFLSDNI